MVLAHSCSRLAEMMMRSRQMLGSVRRSKARVASRSSASRVQPQKSNAHYGDRRSCRIGALLPYDRAVAERDDVLDFGRDPRVAH
jgi:hypothetical protein